jgi:hypothetical protein
MVQHCGRNHFFCFWCLLLVCWQLRNFITQARVSMIVSCYDWNCAHQPLRSQNLCTKFQHFLLPCLFFTGCTIFRCCVRAFSIASWRAQLGTHQHHWNGPDLCEQVTTSTLWWIWQPWSGKMFMSAIALYHLVIGSDIRLRIPWDWVDLSTILKYRVGWIMQVPDTFSHVWLQLLRLMMFYKFCNICPHAAL